MSHAPHNQPPPTWRRPALPTRAEDLAGATDEQVRAMWQRTDLDADQREQVFREHLARGLDTDDPPAFETLGCFWEEKFGEAA